MLKQLKLIQFIKEATRGTEHYQTLIDHFESNIIIFAARKQKVKKPVKYICSRSYRKYDRFAYYAEISQIAWSPLLQCSDANTALDMFHRLLLVVIDKHAPYQFIKAREDSAKWITNEFLSLLDGRNNRIKKYEKYLTQINWQL